MTLDAGRSCRSWSWQRCSGEAARSHDRHLNLSHPFLSSNLALHLIAKLPLNTQITCLHLRWFTMLAFPTLTQSLVWAGFMSPALRAADDTNVAKVCHAIKTLSSVDQVLASRQVKQSHGQIQDGPPLPWPPLPHDLLGVDILASPFSPPPADGNFPAWQQSLETATAEALAAAGRGQQGAPRRSRNRLPLPSTPGTALGLPQIGPETDGGLAALVSRRHPGQQKAVDGVGRDLRLGGTGGGWLRWFRRFMRFRLG